MVKTKKLTKRKVRRHSGGVYKKGEIPIFTSEYKGIIKVCPSLIENDKYCKYIVPRNLLADTVGKSLFNKNRWEDIVQAVDTKSKLNAYNDVAADIGFEQLTRERAAADEPASILPEEGEREALIGVQDSTLKKGKKITNWNPEMPASGITNPRFAPPIPIKPTIRNAPTSNIPTRINLPTNRTRNWVKFSNGGKHKTRKHKTKSKKKSRKYRK